MFYNFDINNGAKMSNKSPMDIVRELNSAGYRDAAELIKMLCRQSAEHFKERDALLKMLEKHS